MPRRTAKIALAALLSVPIVLAAGAEMAHADSQLKITSTTTYTVDADTGAVHVVAAMELQNLYGCGGSIIYYYTGFSVPIPTGSTPALATTPSARILATTYAPLPDTDQYLLLSVPFGFNLYCHQKTEVTIAYDLGGSSPRTDNPSRVNAAYAAFLAFGVGDDVAIRVVVPAGYTSETFGDSVVETHENGNTVYSADNVENPDEFNVFVSASNNDALVQTEVTTDDGEEFRLQAWPGDTDWQEFMTTQIETGVPVLSKLIGQPWPIDEPVDVRESYTPYLYGYAGWFSLKDDEIEIGEYLDADTALHELSHAWFSDEWFSDRWLNEGFAQVFASKGVEELGGDGLQPTAIVPSDPGKVLLNDWGHPSYTPLSGEIDDIEAYGYNASFQVLQQITDEIGDAKLREVLDAVANDTTAYRGDAEPEAAVSVTDWRRFLDLVEEIGGSTKAADLFENYVLTASQSSLLADRATARDQYHELVDDGGDWAAPVVVRERMAVWNFKKATELIAAAEDVIALRDELDAKVAQLDTTYPDDLELLYEGADDDFDDAKAAVQEQIDTADALLAAVAAEGKGDGLFGSIGLIGTDLNKTLADAKAAFAAGDQKQAGELSQDVIDKVHGASSAGQKRALLAALVLLILGVGIALLIRKRKRNQQLASGDSTDAPVAVGGDIDNAGSIDGDALGKGEHRSSTDSVSEPDG